jgi:hypothetical protein
VQLLGTEKKNCSKNVMNEVRDSELDKIINGKNGRKQEVIAFLNFLLNLEKQKEEISQYSLQFQNMAI